ncbi:MAG: hypothetical protein ACRCTU_16415 [Zoogloea sp.]|uniref:hypothetical protein n=1 Tax=Zoogloea sp. TaxID=49181 RepID=UPI003F31D7C3
MKYGCNAAALPAKGSWQPCCLLAFFDRPASKDCLDALRQTPPLPQIGQAITNIKPAQWETTLTQLVKLGLIQHANKNDHVDAHPLIRAYLEKRLSQDFPEAWRKGHKRLFQHLQKMAPKNPENLNDLQPLYQAVAHGCKAGLYQDAFEKVYHNKILHRDQCFSIRKLGAFGADLGAVACFFVEPWQRLALSCPANMQAWLLSEAAFRLRALGRLTEALEPMQKGAQMLLRQKNWENAARAYNNLSELQLNLGQTNKALQSAQEAVAHAMHSENKYLCMLFPSTLADTQHQSGNIASAHENFELAEKLQTEDQPQYPLLYSLRGFQYCDLLLMPILQKSWEIIITPHKKNQHTPIDLITNLTTILESVTKRAQQTLGWATSNHADLLTFAVEHLTLARCALYDDLLHGRLPGQDAQKHCQTSISKLREAGRADNLPHGLLTRALLHFTLGDEAQARADLDEVEQIATRGGMRLHLADLALTRARLFRDKAQLALARQLIEECGYGRRLPELEDAEAALNGH